MEALFIILVVILLLIGLAGLKKDSKPTSLNCEVVHVDRDESYVSWYDEHSRLHQETDGCSDCIQARAEQLQAQGVKLWRVELGRRNTGEL